ncbi:MAG: Asp23/Gls24 family envelope stress response protein [Christensenellales bacterium]|jgi:uncharacterized alkaline shock family protein YloU
MPGKLVNDLGAITISDQVLGTLAGAFAVECYGVVGMASKKASDGIVELLGRDNLSRGVKIAVQDNRMVVDLFIIVQYGTSMAAVAQNIIDTVKYNLEQTTGMTVTEVNVTIEGVRVQS